MLHGNIITSKPKSFLRNALTVFQFVVSIALIFCITVIQKQISFVKNQNLGFEKEQLLRIDVPNIQITDVPKAFALIDKLKQYPGIKNLSMSMGVPGSISMHMGSGVKDKSKLIAVITVDSSFLKTFKVKQVKGRSLLPGDINNACMIKRICLQIFW